LKIVGMKNNNKITNAKKGGASQYSRTSILFLLFCGALVVVILKLYYVQVIAYDRYMNLAERQHKMEKNLVSSRGEIFFGVYIT
jgi:cell division protein FtsI/penicillin-binding protein 2